MQSAIFSANIIPSLFAPWHWANILGLQKSERSGKPNCVSFAFWVLCTCGINYSAILQQFKGKFENVYCCISFAFSRFSICALEFLKFLFIYMPVGLRTWHRVNSAADRVKPSWRTAVGSSLSKDSPVLSLFRVRPWLLGWTLSIFLPTPGYFPWRNSFI